MNAVEKIVFRNNKGQKIVGLLFKPKNQKDFPLAIFCHGYRSTKESSKVAPLAAKLTSNGIGLLAFDFSGRGESEGKFEETTLTQYIDDLKYAIDYCIRTTDKIAVIGNSLGGIVALEETARDTRVKLLVLLSPVSRFPWRRTKEFSDIKSWKSQGCAFTPSERFGKLKINYSFYEDGLKYGNHNRYEKISVPVLILHGSIDESVNVEDSKKLSEHLSNCRLIIIEGADHNCTKKEHFDKIVNGSVNFICEKISL